MFGHTEIITYYAVGNHFNPCHIDKLILSMNTINLIH